MPRIVSDIVDVYVFRRLHGRVQFLLLQRRNDVTLGQTWQSFHSQIHMGETTFKTVNRVVTDTIGLEIDDVYSADYINQFYDEGRDALVLSPVFAVTLRDPGPVQLSAEFRDAAWLDRDSATVRLPFSGQRWAVRHIDEIMSLGDDERAIYKLDTDIWQPTQGIADSVNPATVSPESDGSTPDDSSTEDIEGVVEDTSSDQHEN